MLLTLSRRRLFALVTWMKGDSASKAEVPVIVARLLGLLGPVRVTLMIPVRGGEVHEHPPVATTRVSPQS
jgi:hypothetical protein